MKTLRTWLVRLAIVVAPFASILFWAAFAYGIEGANFHDMLTLGLVWALLLMSVCLASEYQPARVKAR